MYFRMTLIAMCAVALGFATTAIAEPQEVVTTTTGNSVVKSEKFGTCVQTKWTAANDPCAPEAPKVVALPPEPAPAPEPATTLAREQLTIYFGFNKDVLTPESKNKLDQIADAVNRSPKVLKVKIVGYTDKIGTNSYNEKLSVRRAQAVKSYLDSKARIPASVEALRGLGEQDPVTHGCMKLKNRKAKIACMAKDRRTEIEFEFQQ